MIWVGKGNYGFIRLCLVRLDYLRGAKAFDPDYVLRCKKTEDFHWIICCLEIVFILWETAIYVEFFMDKHLIGFGNL